jgi:hypothetical protein
VSKHTLYTGPRHKQCRQCNEWFYVRNKVHRFCSSACRQKRFIRAYRRKTGRSYRHKERP